MRNPCHGSHTAQLLEGSCCLSPSRVKLPLLGLQMYPQAGGVSQGPLWHWLYLSATSSSFDSIVGRCFSFPSWPNFPLAAVKVSCCEESSSDVLWEKKLSWLRKRQNCSVAWVREPHVAHWSSRGRWLRCIRNWNSERKLAYIDKLVKSWKDGFNLIVFLPFLASVSPCVFVLWGCFGIWKWFCLLVS